MSRRLIVVTSILLGILSCMFIRASGDTTPVRVEVCAVAPCGSFAEEVIAPYVEVSSEGRQGAGVVISHANGVFVLTARHVVQATPVAELYKFSTCGQRSTAWVADVVRVSESADLALLKPRAPDGLTPAKWDVNIAAETGEDAWYIGTHTGIHGSLEKTIVNKPKHFEDGHPFLLMNGNAWYGNSGGPAFLKRGGHYYLAGIVVRLAVLNPRTPICAENVSTIDKFLRGEKEGADAAMSHTVSLDTEQDVKDKIELLVNRRFAGDYRAAFKFYAGSDGFLDRRELNELYTAARIGTVVTRPLFVDETFARLDSNRDELLSWQEVESIRARKKTNDRKSRR